VVVFTIKGFYLKKEKDKISGGFKILGTVLLAEAEEHMPWETLRVINDDKLGVDRSNLD
jgi:hypothetical protein